MPKSVVARDSALAEITLRRYEKPVNIQRRDLIKKLCLSIGLLQPGDSRDIIVDIFQDLLDAKKDKKKLDSEEIKGMVIDLRKKEKLPLKGIASSNIRRQLKRLRGLFLAEKIENSYRITEFDELKNIFEEKIEKYYLKNITERIKEYFDALG